MGKQSKVGGAQARKTGMAEGERLNGSIGRGAGDGNGGFEESLPHSGEAGGAAHDGACVLPVEYEASVLEDARNSGGFEFAGGLRRSFGNL